MRIWILVLTLAIWPSLSACGSLANSLPQTIPPDFALSLRQDGGMRPVSSTFSVTAGADRYQKSYYFDGQNVAADWAFFIEPEPINRLYRMLRDCGLERITTHQEKIYDRGGQSLRLEFDEQILDIADSGMSLIEPEWTSQWQTALAAIEQRRAEVLAKTGASLTFTLSAPVSGCADFYLGLDDDSLYYQPDAKAGPISVRLFPGQYVVTMRSAKSGWESDQIVAVAADRTYTINLRVPGFQLD